MQTSSDEKPSRIKKTSIDAIRRLKVSNVQKTSCNADTLSDGKNSRDENNSSDEKNSSYDIHSSFGTKTFRDAITSSFDKTSGDENTFSDDMTSSDETPSSDVNSGEDPELANQWLTASTDGDQITHSCDASSTGHNGSTDAPVKTTQSYQEKEVQCDFPDTCLDCDGPLVLESVFCRSCHSPFFVKISGVEEESCLACPAPD